MNPLVIIAIANAVLWAGIILWLLLALLRDSRRINAQIDRLEHRLTEQGVEELERLP